MIGKRHSQLRQRVVALALAHRREQGDDRGPSVGLVDTGALCHAAGELSDVEALGLFVGRQEVLLQLPWTAAPRGPPRGARPQLP